MWLIFENPLCATDRLCICWCLGGLFYTYIHLMYYVIYILGMQRILYSRIFYFNSLWKILVYCFKFLKIYFKYNYITSSLQSLPHILLLFLWLFMHTCGAVNVYVCVHKYVHKYINIIYWVHFCCLCVYSFKANLCIG